MNDIVKNWEILSQNSTFHAILATSSIPEALDYYHHFKTSAPQLKVTAIFDPSIDNTGGEKIRKKEEGLIELISDYNEKFEQNFTAASFDKMKEDIRNRLAHKKPYERIDCKPEQELDLLIVVDQMLTGFDSKWINTLYLDKIIEYENIIQAFSRTNRIFGPEKPFGTIKYYRKPHTMKNNIDAAINLYSGNAPLGLFVEKLHGNLFKINLLFIEIEDLFKSEKINNFEKLPSDIASRKKFAKLFKELNEHLEAAKIQGFKWSHLDYSTKDENTGVIQEIRLKLDETTYLILVKRYKELSISNGSSGDPDIPYDLCGYISTIDTGKIDSDYMNSRFEKYTKLLSTSRPGDTELQEAENELHKTFASLSQEEQKFANIFLHDIQRGDVIPIPGKTFKDYIVEYASNVQNDQIHKFALTFGVDENLLRNMLSQHPTENNINDFGRFNSLKSTANDDKAKSYFENKFGKTIPKPKVKIKFENLLREFVLKGECDI